MGYKKIRLEFILVALQFSFLFLLFLHAIFSFKYRLNLLSFIIFCLGIFLGIWSLFTMSKYSTFSIFPSPKKSTKLLKKGPYAYIRHPMYISILVSLLPFIFDITSFLLYFILFIILSLKINYEEKILSTKIKGYREYKKSTKRMIPWIF